jgi:hypothetical protein
MELTLSSRLLCDYGVLKYDCGGCRPLFFGYLKGLFKDGKRDGPNSHPFFTPSTFSVDPTSIECFFF